MFGELESGGSEDSESPATDLAEQERRRDGVDVGIRPPQNDGCFNRDGDRMTDEIDIGDEELLFKYVPPARAMTCLPEVGDGALRATQPATMNDPFECTVSKIFVESDRDRGNLVFARTLTEIQRRNPVSPTDVEAAWSQYGSLYMGELYNRGWCCRSARGDELRHLGRAGGGVTAPGKACVREPECQY